MPSHNRGSSIDGEQGQHPGAINLIDAVALHIIRGAFVDLAGAFARIDAVAAEAAVNAVAGDMIASLPAFRSKSRERSERFGLQFEHAPSHIRHLECLRDRVGKFS